MNEPWGVMGWLSRWTLSHGWFGWWLPGFISGAAFVGILWLVAKAVEG